MSGWGDERSRTHGIPAASQDFETLGDGGHEKFERRAGSSEEADRERGLEAIDWESMPKGGRPRIAR